MAANRGTASPASSASRIVAADDRAPTLILRRLPRVFQDGSSIMASFSSLVQTMTCAACALNESLASTFKKDSSRKRKPAGKELTDANVKQVHLLLDNIKEQLTGTMQRGIQHSIEEMASMGDEQQQQLVLFWQQIANFMDDLLAWFDCVIDSIVKKLVDGFHVDSAEMERIFEQAVAELNRALRGGYPSPLPFDSQDPPQKRQVSESEYCHKK